jgi:hypothetical protein
MDYLTCPFEVKASSDDDGIITGYGSVFGNVDSDGDIVAKGAFVQTIADVKSGASQWPAMLLQHGGKSAASQMPIGIWTSIDEDDKGLRLTGKLANTKNGREALALLKMKPWPALNGLSIGYRTKDYELHHGSGPNGAKRTLKQVDLVEVSLVTTPADRFARVTSIKARSEEDEAALRKQWALADFLMLRRLTNRGASK